MKKYILLFLLAFISFFAIDKVYAISWINNLPTSLKHCNLNDVNCNSLSGSSLVSYTTQDNTYIGYDFQVQKAKVSFFYNVDLPAGYYDFGFNMFSNQVVNSLSDVSVSVNKFNCQVSQASKVTGPFWVDNGSHNDFEYRYDLKTDSFFNVSCSNVYLDGDGEFIVALNQSPSSVGEIAINRTIAVSYAMNNYLEIIANGSAEQKQQLEELNKSQKEIAKETKETNDFLKDDTAPETDISSLGTVQGLLPEGPVDSLLNIPLYFLSVITSSFGGVCVPLEGKFVFDSTLSIPCFSEMFYDNVPAGLMIFINLIPSTFILMKYFKHLYKKVDRAVSMNSNSDDEWGVL